MDAVVCKNYETSWLAKLDLTYLQRDKKTILAGKKHSGPLIVQKPFYPESNGTCHTYLIHPPGGIVGGDQLRLSATLGRNSHALITTPAATKFYRSNGNIAIQQQEFFVGESSTLEWLPQETVYFNDAFTSSKTKINIDSKTKLFAWEIQCLGLPAQKEFFTSGKCIQKFEIWKDNKPILLEANRLIGGDPALTSDWGLQNNNAIGTFIISGNDDIDLSSLIMTIKKNHQTVVAEHTFIHSFYIIRAMGEHTEKLKEFFIEIWKTLRPLILGFEACPPRIWNT